MTRSMNARFRGVHPCRSEDSGMLIDHERRWSLMVQVSSMASGSQKGEL